MSGHRILVVDDETQIRRALEIALRGHGYDVSLAGGGSEALVALGTNTPDLLILDLMLPDIEGLTLLEEVRSWSEMPILVLSARGEEAVKVQALDFGADDYLTKPFSSGELLARVRALLRRGHPPDQPRVEIGNLVFDFANHRVTRNGVDIHLTPTEYDLIVALVQNRGKLMTHRQLLQRVWGDYASENVRQLRVYISYLRGKLEDDPHNPTLILTEPGIGYRVTESTHNF
ncbi:MAG: response regulator [Thermomicrobiales bacterium]